MRKRSNFSLPRRRDLLRAGALGALVNFPWEMAHSLLYREAATERLALRLGWWSYGASMPRVPGTGLGVSPLAQFVALPLLVLFWLLPRRWGFDSGSADPETPSRPVRRRDTSPLAAPSVMRR